MNTTNLFVELLVIGVSAIIWFMLIIFSVFGYHWFPNDQIVSPLYIIPAIAFTYYLGIVTDRIADKLFRIIWKDEFIGRVYKSKEKYQIDKVYIMNNSEKISERMEYGRSRLRICRGWAFNLIIIALSLLLFYSSNHKIYTTDPLSMLLTILLPLILAVLSLLSWRYLAITEVKKTKEYKKLVN